MIRVLLLGGTTQASALAKTMADQGIAGVFSYAGRTESPKPQPLPQRIGGFGGVPGLVDYLRANSISHIVDATHPFAAQMSSHAVEAAALTGLPLLALESPVWLPTRQDRWRRVPSMADAVRALPDDAARIFLAIGRLQLEEFAVKPQHHYLLRLVDPTDYVPLPHTTTVISRGPFTVENDLRLLTTHKITHIVAKNAGGDGARAKLDAARSLGLPVIMVDRPFIPDRPKVALVTDVLRWFHGENLGV